MRHTEDIDDELDRLRIELEREVQNAVSFCPHCGSSLDHAVTFCPECGERIDGLETSGPSVNMLTRFSLPHYVNLEEESKTKIGTFERLMVTSGDFPTSYGFENRDFAQYVNLLSGMLELECNLSVYQCQRMAHGIAMPQWFGRDCKRIQQYEQDIHVTNGKLTLGELYFNLLNDTDFCSFLRKNSIVDISLLLDSLKRMREPRNEASHGEVISQGKFTEFYASFRNFYDKVLPALLRLKIHLRG